MKSEIVLKTKRQIDRKQRDLAIYNEYNELIQISGASRTAIVHHLMKKYNIYGASTVYVILNRVSASKNIDSK